MGSKIIKHDTILDNVSRHDFDYLHKYIYMYSVQLLTITYIFYNVTSNATCKFYLFRLHLYATCMFLSLQVASMNSRVIYHQMERMKQVCDGLYCICS